MTTMKKVDRNYAPRGYHAVVDKSRTGCVGCAFESDTQCGLGRKCASFERPDKQEVIFIKMMTPEQKLKWAVLARVAACEGVPAPAYPCDDVDARHDALEEGARQDARNDVRCGGVKTDLPCDFSRHYESKAVAMRFPDGSWVGWTYWYGGGKHGEPAAMGWMDDAYDVDCHEEEKMVVVRTFTKVE